MSRGINNNNHRPGEISFRVRTTWDWQKITSVIDLFKGEEMLSRMSHKVVEIQERHIQKGLINLGWTPPESVQEDIDNDNLLDQDEN